MPQQALTTQQFIMILISITIAVGGQILLKLGLKDDPFAAAQLADTGIIATYVGVMFKPMVLAGLITYGLSAVVWLWVLSKVPLTVAYPMVGLSYILTLIPGYFLFAEKISMLRIIGILLIIQGVILITLSGKSAPN